MGSRQFSVLILLPFLGASSVAWSNNDINIHISENNVEQSETAFFMDGGKASLDTISSSDTKKLAQSIEFEVYKIQESYSSRTVFASPAGICYGYKSANGVSYANSTHHYLLLNDDSQYYGSVTGAIIYYKGETKNLSYVPVYSINDQYLSREIQRQEGHNIKTKALAHIEDGKAILSNMVCK